MAADEKLVLLSPKDTPAKLNVAADHSYLGALAQRAGKFSESAGELKLALDVLRTHCATDVKDVRARVSLIHNLTMAGLTEQKLGHAGAARALLQEALAAEEVLPAASEIRKRSQDVLDAARVTATELGLHP